MKRITFFKITLFISVLLFFISTTQAQDWLNNQNIIVHTNLKTDVSVQKVKPYNSNILIGLSKDSYSSDYCFTLWENNNDTVRHSYLNINGLSISDFTILGDTIYFCGKWEIYSQSPKGVIGRFNINDFFDDGDFSFNYTKLDDVQNLTCLVAYYAGIDTVSIMAIGHDSLNDITPGRIVHLKLGEANPYLTYEYFTCPNISTTEKEILHDICLSSNEVITLSHIYPINQYIIRTFRKSSSPTNIRNVVYTFPNLTFNTSSNVYEYPFHLANISNVKMAVCATVQEDDNGYTMVNILKHHSSVVLSTQLIHHKDTINKALEMEYSSRTEDLMLLNSCNFPGYSMMETMTYLNTDTISDYSTRIEYFSPPYRLNHFSITPRGKYAAVGGIGNESSYFYQMLTVNNIKFTSDSCIYIDQVDIDITEMPNGVYDSSDGFDLRNVFWSNGFATNEEDDIRTYCTND